MIDTGALGAVDAFFETDFFARTGLAFFSISGFFNNMLLPMSRLDRTMAVFISKVC